MGQVAFDTLQRQKSLKLLGSLENRLGRFHSLYASRNEVADLATKRDLEDVRKEMIARFEKNEAQISLVRKDLQLEMAGIRSEQKLICISRDLI